MQGTYSEEALSSSSSTYNSLLHPNHYWMPWLLHHAMLMPFEVLPFGPFWVFLWFWVLLGVKQHVPHLMWWLFHQPIEHIFSILINCFFRQYCLNIWIGSDLILLFRCVFRRVRRITFNFIFRGRFIFKVTHIPKKCQCLFCSVELTYNQ